MRLTFPRISFALIAIALLSYAFVGAPHLENALAKRHDAALQHTIALHKATVPVQFPAAGTDFIGVTTSAGPADFTEVDKFTTAAGRQPSVMMFTQGWAVNTTFDRSAFDRIAARNMLPMLSWEPWDYHDDTPDHNGVYPTQPKYRLSNIINGSFDSYIRSYAQGVKGLGYTIALRFAHEMNGFWYPWGANVNGNQPGDYVKAWRHVHDVFASVGATNVIWVWSPNIDYTSSVKLKPLYPGDAYVNWVGLSGYYGTAGLQHYETFNQIFNKTLKDLATFTNKPIIVSETAATNQSGLRTQWIENLFKELPTHPNIIGFIWYEAVKELDWRITSPPSAGKAFAAGAALPRFAATWKPGMIARTTVS
ncbi:MAG TPA: glycosyl hydrolase [Micromonosporaceae bacterium]